MAITKISYEKGGQLPPNTSVILVWSQEQGTQPGGKADQRGISKSNAKEKLGAKKEAVTRKRRGGTSFGGNVEPAQNITRVSFMLLLNFRAVQGKRNHTSCSLPSFPVQVQLERADLTLKLGKVSQISFTKPEHHTHELSSFNLSPSYFHCTNCFEYL